MILLFLGGARGGSYYKEELLYYNEPLPNPPITGEGIYFGLDISTHIQYNRRTFRNPEFINYKSEITRMAQKNMIKLQCEQCKTINHYSKKNKQKLKDRLELKKLCPGCGTHKLHKETK